MAVSLSSLRVVAEMDTRSFERGAQSVAESSQRAGAALTDFNSRVGKSDAIERFSRQMIDGYGASQRFTAGLSTINRALETGRYSATQAEAALEGLHRKLGMTANSGELAARGQMQLASAVEAVNRRLAERARLPSGGMALADNDNDAGRFRRQNLGYQLMDIGQSGFGGASALMIAAQQGPQIVQLYAGQGGVNAALKDTGAILGGVATKFAPIAVAAGVAALGISALQSDIKDATGVAVTFGDTAMGVLQATGDLVMTALKPAIDTIGPVFASTWDVATSATKDAGNLIIGAVKGTVDAIIATWRNLPAAIGDLTIQAMNGMLDQIQIGLDNLLIRFQYSLKHLSEVFAGTWLEFAPPPIDTEEILGELGSWRMNNPFPNRAAQVGAGIGGAYREAIGPDYLGDAWKGAVGAVSDHAVENARQREAAAAGEKTGKVTGDQASAYDRVVASARERIDQMELEISLAGQSGSAIAADSVETADIPLFRAAWEPPS